MLETRSKKQTPLKFTPEPSWVDYSATTGLVAKFGTHLISFKLYMLEKWVKKQPPF